MVQPLIVWWAIHVTYLGHQHVLGACRKTRLLLLAGYHAPLTLRSRASPFPGTVSCLINGH
jgi:hypothetical protein